MAGCGCGGFKSMNGLGSSPDGLGQYDINRAGDFGGVAGAVAGLGAAACGFSGAIYGAIIGAAVGYISKGQLGKGALWGAAIGGVGYGAVCAAGGYAAAKTAEAAVTEMQNQFPPPGIVPSFPQGPSPVPGTSGLGAYYVV